MRGKYVNSPEGDLFKKSAILYGLHLARTSIAKQDRAAVVEGNTDVIALRQAGFEPVVASMGTALTERQLRELGRLTRQHLPLLRCRRGRPGRQPARHGARGRAGVRRQGRHAAARAGSCRRARGVRGPARGRESYLLYRVRLELDRSADRQEGFVRAREVLAKAEDSPERQEALRLVADRLDLPRETLVRAGARARAVTERSRDRRRRACSTRGIGSSATRSPPASRIRHSCAGSPSSVPEYFDSEVTPVPRGARLREGRSRS